MKGSPTKTLERGLGASKFMTVFACWEGGAHREDQESLHSPLTPCCLLLFHSAVPELYPM